MDRVRGWLDPDGADGWRAALSAAVHGCAGAAPVGEAVVVWVVDGGRWTVVEGPGPLVDCLDGFDWPEPDRARVTLTVWSPG